MNAKLERLQGPALTVIYDVKAANPNQMTFWPAQDNVVVVKYRQLLKLEEFFDLPLHTQLAELKKPVMQKLRMTYSDATGLHDLNTAIELAVSLARKQHYASVKLSETGVK